MTRDSKTTSSDQLGKDEREIMEIFGDLMQENSKDELNHTDKSSTNPWVTMGLAGVFVIAHGAVLLSLPPVLRGKGAPYLPTTSENMDRMFRLIRKQPQIMRKLQIQQNNEISNSVASFASNSQLKFVDLGSGDGRMVFRSAREKNLFGCSVGYEINPVLHIFAQTRRVIQFSSYYSNTMFYRKDLWKVDLSHTDVIAVYGLHPIMDKLGRKIEEEATSGTIVVSNIFSIPGWKPITVENGVFIYSIPESLKSES